MNPRNRTRLKSLSKFSWVCANLHASPDEYRQQRPISSYPWPNYTIIIFPFRLLGARMTLIYASSFFFFVFLLNNLVVRNSPF